MDPQNFGTQPPLQNSIPQDFKSPVITPPPKPTSFWKRTILIWSIFILLAIAALGAYFWASAKPASISGLEIAVKTASFLGKTFRPDGSVLGGFSCSQGSQNKCGTPITLSAAAPHYGQAIFSYVLLAEATGDQSHKAKADRAINYVLDRCDTDIHMCEWNFFPLAQYYEKTKEEKYLTRGMLRPAEQFLTRPDSAVINGNVGHKLASLYRATQDERYKNRLLEIADAELLKQTVSPDLTFQIIWSIYLPSYKITNDPKYLLASESFFNSYDMAERVMSEEFKNPGSIANLIKAADALLSLAELSENREAYRMQAKSVLQAVLNKLWDTPQSLKFNGDYGFLDVDMSTTEEEIHKSTLFNGWLIKLFVLMKDERFEQPVAE